MMLEEFFEKYKKEIIISGAVLGFIIIVVFLISLKSKPTNELGLQNESAKNSYSQNVGESESNQSASSSSNGQIVVDVKGAVKSPGVYEVKEGMRVNDAIELAGGLSSSADRKNINLALQLSDQQVIYVPIKGEIKDKDSVILKNAMQSGSTADVTSDKSNGEVVNINSAEKDDLTKLNGIGDKKADQIISYRDEQGPFKKIEDLKNVSGIGDKIFDGLKDSITV